MMRRLDSFFDSPDSGLGLDRARMAKARRAEQVRTMWKSLVEPVFLDHTNAIYIFEKDGVRQMHTYVDESIYAAELNNRRELILLLCRDRFGEDIDEFHIHISRGSMKKRKPFASDSRDEEQSVPLTPEERTQAQLWANRIGSSRVRNSFERALVADLEWKKGLSQPDNRV